MGDPLSVAASIVGILAAAAKVVEIVQPFISNTKDAPKVADTVYTQVNQVRIILGSLETFLQDLSAPSSVRASFIQVECIVVFFTDGVLIFSELESLLSPLKLLNEDNSSPLQLRQRISWGLKQSAISALMNRVRNFSASLSVMLNIFQW